MIPASVTAENAQSQLMIYVLAETSDQPLISRF
jgi:hypothetical protein